VLRHFSLAIFFIKQLLRSHKKDVDLKSNNVLLILRIRHPPVV
jgi:hypothetical protein